MQNYCQLLQVAHTINQFVEKSTDMVELLNEHSKQAIKVLWKEPVTYLKSIPYDQEQLLIFLTKKQNCGNEYVGEIYQQGLHCPKVGALKKITVII
jgi:ABC-type Fe3+-citrate transport system substrate-binding protein